MIKEFIQKRGFNFRKFYLYSDKIVVESKTMSKIEKYEVKMDRVGFNTFYQADNVAVGKMLFVVFVIAPFFLLALRVYSEQKLSIEGLIIGTIFFWGFALLNYLKQHQDDIFLKGQQDLVFYRNIPSEIEVIEFIDLIVLTSKRYLKKKYFRFDENTDENEFKNTMRWLLDNDVISISEFEKIKYEFHIKRIL